MDAGWTTNRRQKSRTLPRRREEEKEWRRKDGKRNQWLISSTFYEQLFRQ